MARRKNPADDFKFEIVYEGEMTMGELEYILDMLADQAIKNWQKQKLEKQDNSTSQDEVK